MTSKPAETSGRLFRNPALEALTRTHISVPVTIFYGTAAAAWWLSVVKHRSIGPQEAAAILAAGIIFFTFVEYAVHRWFYHMEPRTPRRARIRFVLHGVHHEHPRDKQRLALPPVLSVLVAAVFMGLFRLLLGPQGLPFGAGFLGGYATYLLIHYSVHAFRPPRNFLRALWKHHNLHHYASDERAFGVSSPLWDMVFGTMPEEPARRKVSA